MDPTASDHLDDQALARLGLTRETDIVLDREGRFLSGGVPVAHPGVAAAFARWIARAPGGRYVLRNDLHYVFLAVQGAPLHARRVEVAPGGAGATLRLQGGEEQPLRAETLRLGPDGALYADARDGTWPVRLSPQAALDLAPWLEESPGGAVLRLAGRSTPVPAVEDPLRPRGGAQGVQGAGRSGAEEA